MTWKSPLAAISMGLQSSPAAKCNASDFWSDTNDVELLDFLFSSVVPYFTFFKTLIHPPSPSARAAILYYLPFSPVVPRDIRALIPALLDDHEIMISLATNITYYHARELIPEWELEYLLMQILTCRNREGAHRDDIDRKVVEFYHLTLWQVQRYRQYYVPRSKRNTQARDQKELEYDVKRKEKSSKRERAAIQKKLNLNWRVQSDVPLPYGCNTLADVYIDVNETYDPSYVAAVPVDWAQSVLHSDESKEIYVISPAVNLPLQGTDVRGLQIVNSADTVSVYEDCWCSKTRASFEPLNHCAGSITVKLPKSNKYISSKA